MAFETLFDGQYGGLGITPSTADTGDTTFTTTPVTITATFALVGGIQPTVVRGKLYLETKSLNAAAVLGGVSLSVSDGTHVEYLAPYVAPPSAVAGQGSNYVQEFYCALAACTNIVSVSAAIITTTNNNGVAHLRVLGGP